MDQLHRPFSKIQKTVLAAVAVVFLLSSSVLAVANASRPHGIAPHFDWPDETANAFFAQRFAETGTLKLEVGADVARDARYFLHPRSFNFFDSSIVPAGYLGLPIVYGAAERVLGLLPYVSGTTASLFLTPLLATLALLAFAYVVSRLRGTRAGTYATVVLALTPAYWYYSAYGFLPNVPMIAFLVFTTVFGFKMSTASDMRRKTFFAIASGACLGIAAAIRTVDVVWFALAVSVAIVWSGEWRRQPKRCWIALVVSAAVAFSPVLVLQRLTYGGFLTTGYSRFANGTVLAPTEFSGSASSPIAIILSALVLPFGFHPRAIWYNLWRSFLAIGPWISVPTVGFLVLGAVRGAWYVVRRQFVIGNHRLPLFGREGWGEFRRTMNLRPGQLLPTSSSEEEEIARLTTSPLLVATIVSAWLVASYGSWMIADPLVLKLNTIGVSHVRYWLPISIFGAVAFGVVASRIADKGKTWRAAVIVYLVVCAVLSARLVFFSEKESLVAVAGRVASYDAAAAIVEASTPENAVILTDRTDKEIFPDRTVTPGYPETVEDFRAVASIACNRPLYLYVPWSDEEITRRVDSGELATSLASDVVKGVDDRKAVELVAEPRPGYRLWKLDGTELCATSPK